MSEKSSNIFSRIWEDIREPYVARYLISVGVIISGIGCLGVAVILELAQNPATGVSSGSSWFALFLLAILMVPGGIVVVIFAVAASTRSIPYQKTISNTDKQDVSKPPTPELPKLELTIEQRREILRRYIYAYLGRGYRVVSQTDTTAQMVKPKQFSLGWAIFWLLMIGIGLLIYIFYYIASSDQQVYIDVDLYGQTRIRS